MIYNHFQYHLGDSHSQQHVHPLTLMIYERYGTMNFNGSVERLV
ncbi:hypothetical protein T4B_1640 [Trichinella pseudospiralis]|uniref:Uncharacterized protein n=1 Tax=Trichinella pseudospiralis TaxID=6337 RepID=A0A0V1G7B6_TRIPS|nr:hypothetical protein T4B_1640 [Trichinella pseudospiralis]